MTTTFASHEVQQRLDHALDQLAAQVRQGVPALSYSIQHGGNDSFPWWVVARFANGADENKVVDISIDCQGTPQEWSIRADVARENGFVLQELPPLKPSCPANGEQAIGSIEGVVEQLQGFLSQQVGCVTRELA